MSSYSTGTIAVTNGGTTVTGTGTEWVANVFAGDLIRLPDGLMYFITGVASNTSLTIAPAYAGTTVASGGAYRVAFIPGRLAAIAAAISMANTNYQTYLDGPIAGRFGDGTTAAPGIAFLSDTNTGFRRRTADVITAVCNGADRAEITTTGMTVAGSEVYRRANVLGTVSQSSGVPTGAVIERGSNANGEYVRFADGTQICWSPTITANSDVADGDLFRSDSQSWTYPASFSTLPGGGWFSHAGNAASAVTATFRANASTADTACYTTTSQASRNWKLFAIGRWF